MRHLYRIVLAIMLSFASISAASADSEPKSRTKIVLIGGKPSHGPFEHDFPDGIRLIEKYLVESPDLQGENFQVTAFPDGWPADASVLADSSTIIWYFDGLDQHPLTDEARRKTFDILMRKGVGLVTLHQASTLEANNKTIDLPRWLGGARYGMVDRAVETVAFTPADHAITRGVEPFAYKDEFYPTIRFDTKSITPILTGRLHAVNAVTSATTIMDRPVAWAYERSGGGRSFGFTGLHYLEGLDNPQLRKLLLNAILWTAGFEVPANGVRSGPPTGAEAAIVTPASQMRPMKQEWGRLTWFTSAEIGNSATVTTGEAVIRPGKENPRHYHPNCDEILRVLQGRILHSMGDKVDEMGPGDVAAISAGVKHNARNIGKEDAVLAISYSSAYRRMVGE